MTVAGIRVPLIGPKSKLPNRHGMIVLVDVPDCLTVTVEHRPCVIVTQNARLPAPNRVRYEARWRRILVPDRADALVLAPVCRVTDRAEVCEGGSLCTGPRRGKRDFMQGFSFHIQARAAFICVGPSRPRGRLIAQSVA